MAEEQDKQTQPNQAFSLPEETPQPEEPKTEIDDIIQALEKANIADAKQLEGKLQNAAGYQKLQSNLSETEKRISALESENANLKTSLESNSGRYDIDDFNNTGAPLTEEKIKQILVDHDTQKQQQALYQQREHAALYQKITKDKHYDTVKDDFSKKMQDPDVNFAVNTGQLNAMELYKDTVTEHYQKTTQTALEALKAMKSSGQIAPPHVEDSARVPNMPQDTKTDIEKQVEDFTNKAKGGDALHADERAALIKAKLGDIMK